MSQSGQLGEPSGRVSAARGRGAKSDKSGKSGKSGKSKDNKSKDKKAATQSTGAGKSDGPERPGASGHRFGPELACSECGILWDIHQRDPKPCATKVANDAFARRPAVGFDDNSGTAGTAGTAGIASKSEGTEGQAATPVGSAESRGSSDSATDSTNSD
ncbi:MAG TPA: hypothetical protein EYQ60_17110 [Myxococcales bacterium]|nr:hypothetical protein [Myxococcales bacterium]